MCVCIYINICVCVCVCIFIYIYIYIYIFICFKTIIYVIYKLLFIVINLVITMLLRITDPECSDTEALVFHGCYGNQRSYANHCWFPVVFAS